MPVTEPITTGNRQRRGPAAPATGVPDPSGSEGAAGAQRAVLLSMAAEEQQMCRIRVAARSKGVVIPSSVGFYAAMLLPPLLWCASVLWGVAAFQGLPQNKRDVHHIMLWFDLLVFRTPAGPALPFLVLLLRYLATSRLQPPVEYSLVTLDTLDNGPGSEDKGGSKGVFKGRPAPRLPPPVGATLMPQVFWCYLWITLGRMALYVLHGEMQRRDVALAAVKAGEAEEVVEAVQAVAYLSDHILLGASVTACLQCEVLCSLSDAIKLSAAGVNALWRVFLACAAFMAALTLFCLVAVDMHYTARHFHERPESAVALVSGLILFQLPLMAMLRRRWMPLRPLTAFT